MPETSLEAVIEAVGGPDAWWWGGWAAMSRYHWALRAPDGTWHCGTRPIGSGEEDAIQEFEKYFSHIDQQEEHSHAPWADFEAEQQMASKIGALLVPSPLTDALLDGSTDVSVVIAGNLLGSVALPALCLKPGDETRLIERAILRVQPPAAPDLIASRPPHELPHWPVLVACMNPDGTLDHAEHEDLDCEVRLGSEPIPPGDRYRHATATNLRTAMTGLSPGQQGIFFYSGHVNQAVMPGDANVSLHLADAEVRAAEWFGIGIDRRLPCPSRAVISACASAGSSGTGSGEWLGLGAALLSAGARHVIATAWPIPDAPATQRFERRLIDCLSCTADAARALAELQRKELMRWRYSVNAWEDPVEYGSPVMWAAFQSMGVLDS
jgi:hypothetical protein